MKWFGAAATRLRLRACLFFSAQCKSSPRRTVMCISKLKMRSAILMAHFTIYRAIDLCCAVRSPWANGRHINARRSIRLFGRHKKIFISTRIYGAFDRNEERVRHGGIRFAAGREKRAYNIKMGVSSNARIDANLALSKAHVHQ